MQGGLRRLLGLAASMPGLTGNLPAGTQFGQYPPVDINAAMRTGGLTVEGAGTPVPLRPASTTKVATFESARGLQGNRMNPQDGQLRSLVNRGAPLTITEDDQTYGIPGLEYATPKPIKAPKKLPKLQQY